MVPSSRKCVLSSPQCWKANLLLPTSAPSDVIFTIFEIYHLMPLSCGCRVRGGCSLLCSYFLIGCTPCQELAKRRKWKVHGTPNGSATKSSTNENVWWKSENTDTRRTNTHCFWLCFGFCMVMTTTKKIKIKIKRRTCNSYFSWPFARPVQYGLLDGFHVPVMTAFLYTEHGPIYIILHDEIKLTNSSIPSAENCFAAEQRWCVQVCNDNTRPNCA